MEKHFTTSGLIFDENKILLVKHKKLNSWIYPGGHVEKNESPVECLTREVLEETGCVVEIISDNVFDYSDERATVLARPFCVLEETLNEDDSHKHIDIVYLCRLLSIDKSKMVEDNETEWFTLEEALGLNIMDNFKVILTEAFKYIK